MVDLEKNTTSAKSNVRLSNRYAMEEVKEDEIVQKQQEDVEMMDVNFNFLANIEDQEEAHSHHAFI
jgi:hypothetical protein